MAGTAKIKKEYDLCLDGTPRVHPKSATRFIDRFRKLLERQKVVYMELTYEEYTEFQY